MARCDFNIKSNLLRILGVLSRCRSDKVRILNIEGEFSADVGWVGSLSLWRGCETGRGRGGGRIWPHLVCLFLDIVAVVLLLLTRKAARLKRFLGWPRMSTPDLAAVLFVTLLSFTHTADPEKETSTPSFHRSPPTPMEASGLWRQPWGHGRAPGRVCAVFIKMGLIVLSLRG